MKTLYVSDLDGTLLNSKGEISTTTTTIINKLVSKGMIFTYATARSLVSSLPITKGLTRNLPLIIYNGTFIVYNDDIIYKCVFNNNEVNIVQEIMEQYELKPMVYALVNDKERVTIINDKLHDGTKHYLSNRENDYRINLTDNYSSLYQGEVFYFTVIGDYNNLYPVYDFLKDNPNCNTTLQQEIYRDEYWLEIMPSNASKANAIIKLKELLNCNKVISFGDAINDLSMFKISDECYAMANAVDELKEKATAIIKSNDEDGVANWLLNNY